MSDTCWINATLASTRPRAVAALLRYFRDLDTAEEAYQEACLRALTAWPRNGPPRDPAAWLILVGRNAGLDAHRKRARQVELPEDADLPDAGDTEADLAERLDDGHYRDDILRLLFVCCHPDFPATQQVALALRIVCGLSVRQIARAFLVSEAAMEQRITRAKSRIADAAVPFEAPGAVERAQRLAAVAAVVYLIFNEGYSAGPTESEARAPLCDEAIRLARLLLHLFPAEPEIMGLTALMLIQHARLPARFSAEGEIVLLEAQDRSRWKPHHDRGGSRAHRQGHAPPRPRRLPDPGGHRRPARPRRATGGDRLGADRTALWRAGAVRTLSRGAAEPGRGRFQGQRSGAALAMVEPLADRLSSYFHFHGLRGALLQQTGKHAEAREAFMRAIALANTTAEAAHIRMHLDRLAQDAP